MPCGLTETVAISREERKAGYEICPGYCRFKYILSHSARTETSGVINFIATCVH